jgi:NAD-reducing hydrogenase small subunit
MLALLEGGINNTSNEEVAHKMRSRCKLLVAWATAPCLAASLPCATSSRRKNRCGGLMLKQKAPILKGMIPIDPELAR